MEPFRIATPLIGFCDLYPDPRLLLEVGRKGGERARIALARLWLSEGIPYVFRDCPAMYEAVRSWLSMSLNVHAKEIGLTGSARLGASLSPVKLGKPFNESSDFDIFIISDQLFGVLREEFRRWSYDFESGLVKTSNDQQEAFWRDNNARGPKILDRGFMDQKMIPNLPNYPTIKKISQTMWLFVEKLKITPNAPKPKQASVRCYSSWPAFVRQTTLNLA